MNIWEAIQEMKKGKAVTRTSWHNVAPYSPFCYIRKAHLCETSQGELAAFFKPELAILEEESIMHRTTAGTLIPYQPTQEDLLNVDWEVRQPAALPVKFHDKSAINTGAIFKLHEVKY